MRLERIADLEDPRLADYRDLKASRRRGGFVVEGWLLVRTLLTAARFRARSVFATEAALERLRDVLAGLGERIPVYVARAETISGVVGFAFHRGCLALGESRVELSLDDVLGRAEGRLLVVLEDVTNPDNLGGVFRNAMAFGADAVVLSPGCGDPLYRKAIRVSMGGSLTTPFTRVAEWPRGLERVRGAGFTLVALTPSAAVDIAELGRTRPVPERVALLIGAEGEGLSRAARAAADVEVAIRMVPGVDSLNVATASGIALHRLAAAPR